MLGETLFYFWLLLPFVATIGILVYHGRRERLFSRRERIQTLQELQTLRDRNAELERSNREMEDFAYIASHDLREPLRGISNHAIFLLEDYKTRLDEDGVKRLARLTQLAARMERLIGDLLTFSRLGRAELIAQSIDTNQMLRDIEKNMEPFLKTRNAHIFVPRPMPPMLCDKPRMTEVFRQLIANAATYGDKPEKLIEVGFIPQHGAFYVKDNGPGIAPEFHQEIFRIFKQLNPANNREGGSGVGLTFAKKIIERHRGRIWLESNPGQGSTFYFNLNENQKAQNG